MNEIEAIKVISEALDNLAEAEISRVLTWAFAKYGSHERMPLEISSDRKTKVAVPGASLAETSRQNGIRKGRLSKKSKTILSMDKTLNLTPSGKPSAAEFATGKNPKSVKEKCVVAAYYLRDMIGVAKVNAQGVLTFFKTVQWPVPIDLKNTLQQAGTKGWLDTSSSEDIRLTSLGENLVEHELPAKTKKS